MPKIIKSHVAGFTRDRAMHVPPAVPKSACNTGQIAAKCLTNNTAYVAYLLRNTSSLGVPNHKKIYIGYLIAWGQSDICEITTGNTPQSQWSTRRDIPPRQRAAGFAHAAPGQRPPRRACVPIGVLMPSVGPLYRISYRKRRYNMTLSTPGLPIISCCRIDRCMHS